MVSRAKHALKVHNSPERVLRPVSLSWCLASLAALSRSQSPWFVSIHTHATACKQSSSVYWILPRNQQAYR